MWLMHLCLSLSLSDTIKMLPKKNLAVYDEAYSKSLKAQQRAALFICFQAHSNDLGGLHHYRIPRPITGLIGILPDWSQSANHILANNVPDITFKASIYCNLTNAKTKYTRGEIEWRKDNWPYEDPLLWWPTHSEHYFHIGQGSWEM